MTLTIETGSGNASADSYLSETDADTYHANMGNAAWATYATAAKEAALRQATSYLDRVYALRFPGIKGSSTQALEWPRSSAYDRYGYELASTAIPEAIKKATAELALRAAVGDLQPDQDRGGRVKRETAKIGPIEEQTEYYDGAPSDTAYPRVDDTLAVILKSGHSVVEVARA